MLMFALFSIVFKIVRSVPYVIIFLLFFSFSKKMFSYYLRLFILFLFFFFFFFLKNAFFFPVLKRLVLCSYIQRKPLSLVEFSSFFYVHSIVSLISSSMPTTLDRHSLPLLFCFNFVIVL